MTSQNDQNEKRADHGGRGTFVFLSSCRDHWGGCEELWSIAALRLVGAGHRVYVLKTRVDYGHKRIKELTDAGITVEDHWNPPIPKRELIARRMMSGRLRNYVPHSSYLHLVDVLQHLRPDLTVVAQGGNFDGLDYADGCRQVGVPYAMICQKASDHWWPNDHERKGMRNAFFGSESNYFVSEHNRKLTELQIGARLPKAEVVRNPFLTPVTQALPWPEAPDGRLRLACVARLFLSEKGQDILLHVLSQEKWQARPLDVTFYGSGVDGKALEGMAKLLGMNNVHFAGFTRAVTDIWRTNHGLILPSRCEGLPLSIVEAMYCGRLAIATDVGGNAEVIDEGETGFIATGPTIYELDAALERAWQRHAEWKEMGLLAASRIRTLVPDDPGSVFTEKLLQLRN